MDSPEAGRSDIPTVSGKKLVWIFTLAGVAVIALTTVTFRMVGWSRFVANSRLMEGKSNAIYLARSVMACGEKNGALPETSPKVPADLALVGGKTYASQPSDWSAPAFSCVPFSITQPQGFQYQWVKNDATSGVTRAQADFNGDGIPEATFEQQIVCTQPEGKLRCRPGGFRDLAQ